VEELAGATGKSPHRWLANTALPVLIVVAGTLIANLGSLWGGFVNWDDPANIVENSRVQGFDAARLQWMWTSRHLGVYEPMGWMLKTGTYALFGLKPGAFHAVSLALHGVCAGLAFLLIRRLIRLARPGMDESSATWGSAVGAMLFSVHPLRVECVAWASGQPYLLAAAFGMASVLAYLRACGRPSTRAPWLGVSWLLFVAALLSKTAIAPLPLVFLLLDVYPLRRRMTSNVWIEKLIFAAPAVLVGWYVASTPIESMIGGPPPSAGARTVFGLEGAGLMLVKTVWPSGLSPFYPLPSVVVWSARAVGLVALVGLAVVLSIGCWRRWPGLACAAAAFLVMVAPTLGFVRHGGQLTADRYSYLSCLGFAALAGGLVAAAGPIIQRVVGIGVIGLALLTWRQTSFWGNSLELWSHALAVDPKNWVAHNNLAAELLEEGKTSEAKDHVNAALAQQPDYPDAWLTLGMILEQEGKPEQAIAVYERAVAIRPHHPAALNLGAALQKAGRGDEARGIYEAALRGDPENRALRNNLAAVLMDAKEPAAAEKLLVGLLVENPRDAQTRLNLGILYSRASRPKDAEEQYRAAIAIEPKNAKAHYHLAGALQAMGRGAEAAEEFRRCIEAEPGHVNARAELAVLMERNGDVAAAVGLLEEANKLKPDDVRVSNKLAWILATTGYDEFRDADRAEKLARATCEKLQNRSPQALDTLAAALAARGKFDEAITTAETAARLALERGNEAEVKKIGEHLECYRARKPWIEQATALLRK